MSLAILCPGQGSQHPAMFAGLLGVEPAKPILAKIEALTDLSLDRLGDPQVLTENRIAQILVVGHTLALWSSISDRPAHGLTVAGYSVGDLSAHALAGAISIEDALTLAEARGRAMDRAASEAGTPLGMTGVRGLSQQAIEDMASGSGVEIAQDRAARHSGRSACQTSRRTRRVTHELSALRRDGVRSSSATVRMEAAAPSSAVAHQWGRGDKQSSGGFQPGATDTRSPRLGEHDAGAARIRRDLNARMRRGKSPDEDGGRGDARYRLACGRRFQDRRRAVDLDRSSIVLK